MPASQLLRAAQLYGYSSDLGETHRVLGFSSTLLALLLVVAPALHAWVLLSSGRTAALTVMLCARSSLVDQTARVERGEL